MKKKIIKLQDFIILGTPELLKKFVSDSGISTHSNYLEYYWSEYPYMKVVSNNWGGDPSSEDYFDLGKEYSKAFNIFKYLTKSFFDIDDFVIIKNDPSGEVYKIISNLESFIIENIETKEIKTISISDASEKLEKVYYQKEIIKSSDIVSFEGVLKYFMKL